MIGNARNVGCQALRAITAGFMSLMIGVSTAQAITVTTTADSGAGSIREALALANDNDTIEFSVTGTIELTHGELVVEDNVTINGPGLANLIITGLSEVRVFHILPGKTVTISGLTILLGVAGGTDIPDNAGGCIFNDHANLILSQCVVAGGQATLGGGVFTYSASAAAPASLTIDQCAIRSNFATNSGGDGEGGGVFSKAIDGGKSTVQIANSSFVENSADLRGGGLAANPTGVLLQIPSGEVITTITDTSFLTNMSNFGGGGISIVAGISGHAEATLVRGNFRDNFAASNGGGLLAGATFAGTLELEMTESTFQENSAATGGGASVGASFAAQTGVEMGECVFADNDAGDGGALAHIGERNASSLLRMNRCTFANNIASTHGGALFSHAETSGTAGTIMFESHYTGNSADQGGAIANEQTFNGGSSGIGVFTSTISNNQAKTDGGAFFNSATDDEGAFMLVSHSTVNGNSALEGGAMMNVAEAEGESIVQSLNSTYSGNSATFGGAAVNSGKVDGNARLEFAHCTFSGNAAGLGGGILNSQEVGGRAEVRLTHTILNAGATGVNIFNVDGEIDSGGFNLCSDAAGGDASTGPGGLLIVAGDIRNTNPLLGPLADNGGPTFTHALTNSSPAINAGDPAIIDPPDFDQRGEGFPRVIAGRIDIGAIESLLAAPSNTCPKGKGFWKIHPEAWPVTSLVLGGKTYTKAQLLNILNRSVGSGNNADASLILSHQLIAAKLNIENGSNPAPISATITHADSLLANFAGLLPYRVRPNTAAGQSMIQDAGMLDSYNSGLLTPNCTP